MKKKITEIILEALLEGTKATFDVIEAVLDSGYGSSYAKLDKRVAEIRRRKNKRNLARAELQRFYSLISKLKREGFIQGPSGFLKITSAGKSKFKKMRDLRTGGFPTADYQKEKSNQIVIVAFDIPEKEKRKRQWLRWALTNLGFTLYQRSVWLGKVKIPTNFLIDLRRLHLSSCVGILSVNKSGTLEEYDLD